MCQHNYFAKLIEIVAFDESDDIANLIFKCIYGVYNYNFFPNIALEGQKLKKHHIHELKKLEEFVRLSEAEKASLHADLKFAHNEIMGMVTGIKFLD